MRSDLKTELFAGAQRRAGYDERPPEEPAGREAARESGGAVSGAVVSPPSGAELAPFRASVVGEAPAGWWRALLARVGVGTGGPGEAELADRENERVIRQATWTRAVNVIVANWAAPLFPDAAIWFSQATVGDSLCESRIS